MKHTGPLGGVEIYKKRRQKFLEKIKDGVAIFPSHPHYIRNDDVHYPFRQDSSVYYLSGFTEPESVLVFAPHLKNKFVMFVSEKDPLRELWDGFRYGVEGAKQYFGADHVYPVSEFDKIMPEILKGADKIYYRLDVNKEYDEKIKILMEQSRKLRGRTGAGLQDLQDTRKIVGEMRLFKTKEEISFLKKACEITAHGHVAGMKATEVGKFEYEVQSEIEREFKRRGAPRLGYESIVGRGPNATILHYILNNDQCEDGDLLLVDAGAEYGYMSGDITRTYPVNGKFTRDQKKYYEAVLKVQKSCISMIKPGVKIADVHAHAIEGLTEGMVELGLLKGNVKNLIAKKDFFKYFPHGTSHWLGMDVHDAGLYQVDGKSRTLEPGMCFTVEPGLYVPEHDKHAPKQYRGLGVRIEDDVHVTAKGCEVMTSSAPKEVDEIESTVGLGD